MSVISVLFFMFLAYMLGVINAKNMYKSKYIALRKDFFKLLYLDHKAMQDNEYHIETLELHIDTLSREIKKLKENTNGGYGQR